ncbi:hypothetical protein FQR65_LT07886 [Abscondita terminalis]|nr:hypothetical protein FQR65_LT07886 [Abscondita terminalis]
MVCVALLAFVKGDVNEDVEKFISKVTTNCCEKQGVSVNKMEAIMDKDQLPESNNEFLIFYDCLMYGLNMYDENNEVHFELIEGVFPEYLVKRFGSSLNKELINETFAYCNKHKTVSRALEAIRRRNCGLNYIQNKLNQN